MIAKRPDAKCQHWPLVLISKALHRLLDAQVDKHCAFSTPLEAVICAAIVVRLGTESHGPMPPSSAVRQQPLPTRIHERSRLLSSLLTRLRGDGKSSVRVGNLSPNLTRTLPQP